MPRFSKATFNAALSKRADKILSKGHFNHSLDRSQLIGPLGTIDMVGEFAEYSACIDLQSANFGPSFSNFTSLGASSWTRLETKEDVQIALLKDAADKLGFRLIKKSKK